MVTAAYPPETWAALAVADRAFTRRWGRAMAAFDRENDLRRAMTAYNKIMGPAYQRWQADSAAAVALAEDPF